MIRSAAYNIEKSVLVSEQKWRSAGPPGAIAMEAV